MLFELYLNAIFCVKIYVLYFAIQNNLNPSKTFAKKRDQADRLFMVMVSLLIIYLFHPMSKNPVYVDRETKIYLFVFSMMTLLHQSV